jgi:uncharacterized protein YciI
MSEFPAGVSIEQVFLVEAQYTPEAEMKRPAVRAQHLARIAQLRAAGTIIEAGAYSDGLTSSILLVHASDAAAALAVAQADIYVASGVWGEIEARPFRRVVSED